jgi:hypothetical protein
MREPGGKTIGFEVRVLFLFAISVQNIFSPVLTFGELQSTCVQNSRGFMPKSIVKIVLSD